MACLGALHVRWRARDERAEMGERAHAAKQPTTMDGSRVIELGDSDDDTESTVPTSGKIRSSARKTSLADKEKERLQKRCEDLTIEFTRYKSWAQQRLQQQVQQMRQKQNEEEMKLKNIIEELRESHKMQQKEKEKLEKRIEELTNEFSRCTKESQQKEKTEKEKLEKRIAELTGELSECKDELQQQQQEQLQQISQEGEKIHFKMSLDGFTRRFGLSLKQKGLLSTLKERVEKMTDSDDVPLFWKDEESVIVMESDEDLRAAIEFAQSKNKELPCVILETGPVTKLGSTNKKRTPANADSSIPPSKRGRT